MPRLLLALLLPLPLLAADPPAHRADGDRALDARRVLIKYCAECHADTKGKGGTRMSVLDHRILVGIGGPRSFVSTDKTRSQVVEFMEDGSMPPGGRPRPTADEIKKVREWVDAGAKEYPAKLDDAAVLALIAADLAEQPTPKEVRYVSLAHLADADPAKVAAAETELAEAFAPLVPKGETAWGVLAPLPTTANTVYRLNVGKLHWDEDNLFYVWENGRPKANVAHVVPFDLIQLEYPHPPAGLDAKAAEEVMRKMNTHRDKLPLGQLRAVPFVRGDWLAKALRKDGKPTPLADELAALTKLDEALIGGAKDNTPGPTPRSPFEGGEVGPGESVWAWYRPKVPEKNPPFKLTAILRDPASGSIPEAGGDVVIEAKADKAAAVTLVEVMPGRKVSAIDLEKGTGGKLVAGGAEVVLAGNKEKGNVRPVPPEGYSYPAVYFLVIATAEPLKAPPVVVGSRHALGTVIFRVLPSEQDADATPAAVRAVLPVGVKKEE